MTTSVPRGFSICAARPSASSAIARVVQRRVEDDDVELARFEGQRLEVAAHGHERRLILPRQKRAIGVIVQPIEGDDVVTLPGEPGRQPSASGAEVEHALRPRPEHRGHQPVVALAPDAPFARGVVRLRHFGQLVPEPGDGLVVAVALADSPVLS